MTAKAGLDKDKANVVEEKAGKELADKAKQEKKKDKDKTEVARNPELPKEEKVDSKDVAEVLAPPAKAEDKAKEQPEEKGKEDKAKKDKEAAAKPKDKDKGGEKKAEETEGVKKVEDPKKKAEQQAQKEGGAEKAKPKEMGPQDKLVVEGAKAETEEKRAMGDVFFVASLAALANADRSMLERNVKENGDRSYTVTFYEKDPKAEGGFKPHEVNVVPEGPGKEADESKGKSKEEGKSDRLMSIVKQAYVKWKGGEDKVGEGKSGAAMEALTGKEAKEEHVQKDDTESMWSTLVEACTWNRPVMATSRGEEVSAVFKESEVKPWHAYVVLKCKEVNGKRMITLRNPFGKAGLSEGNTIEVDLEKFAKLYRSVTVGTTLPEKEAKGKKAEDKKQKKADEKDARA